MRLRVTAWSILIVDALALSLSTASFARSACRRRNRGQPRIPQYRQPHGGLSRGAAKGAL
jgi:hypothetical protein